MNALAAELNQRADNLADAVVQGAQNETWLIRGRHSIGKSSLLHALYPRLLDKGLLPVAVSPPPRNMDTGPVALVQIGQGLDDYGLADEFGELEDIQKPWIEKLSMTFRWVEAHKQNVVLLCDEAGSWPSPHTTDDSFSQYSNQHIQEVVSSLHHDLKCRRLFTEPAGQPNGADQVYQLPRDSHPSWLLNDDEGWGDLSTEAHELHDRLGAKLAVATSLDIRLLVALAAVTSVNDVVGFYSQWPDCWAITRRLALAVDSHDEYQGLRTVWARMSICRTEIEQELLDILGVSELAPRERAVLHHGLLHRRGQSFDLHEVLRVHNAIKSWLTTELCLTTHRRLAEYYAAKVEQDKSQDTMRLDTELEGFHHAANVAEAQITERFRTCFVDQLHELGRTLSKEKHDYEAAAEVFSKAIELDDKDHYGHHYLAYNIDSLASNPSLAEKGYRRAIELNMDHPWWWSRWVNFLITLGRTPEARRQWADAVDALNLSGGEGLPAHYQSLHLPVARLLVHRAQYDFAEDVLNDTPDSVIATDTRFRALCQLLTALREAERASAVFPLGIAPAEWWDGPHLAFPRELADGKRLVKWFPGQLRDVDDETVYLVMARRSENQAETEYGQVQIPRSRFDSACVDETSDDLHEGRFIELGFYGDEEVLQIRSHPDEPWEPPDLPPIDPDPRRYLKKAGIAP